jgi:hypothetical protein
MEQSEITSQSTSAPASQEANPAPVPVTPPQQPTGSMILPQQTAYSVQAPGPAIETMSPPFIYAIGRVEPRFPSLAVEKEFAQVVKRAETVNLTDRKALYEVLSDPQNRYLIRMLCWVFIIGGMETYLLQVRDPADLDVLKETVNPERGPSNIEVVIGIRGPIAPPEMCNGLMVPIVGFDQIYSFTRDEFIDAVPRPSTIPKNQEDAFRSAVRELFDRLIQIADNAGAMDEHRALNYLAVRYPNIYARAAESYQQNASLAGVQVRPSVLSGTRRIMEVIFSYTNRQTDVTDKYCVRVDVTEEFPFLVSPLSPYYER